MVLIQVRINGICLPYWLHFIFPLGLNSGSSYGNTSQYNNYSSSTKLVKDSYETNPSTTSNSQSTTTHVTSSAALSLSQTTVGNSKTSTTLGKYINDSIPPSFFFVLFHGGLLFLMKIFGLIFSKTPPQ